MHISEGILNQEIIISTSVIALACVFYTAYKLDKNDIAKTACMSAVFIIASFIHVPIGPASIHLVLSGLIGAFLGINAILAIFIALTLQAFLFGFGGVSVIGVNLIIVGFPALLGRYFLRLSFKKYKKTMWFLAGFTPILISSALLSLILVLNGKSFIAIAALILFSNSILMVVEGVITMFALNYIYKIDKGILKC
ncbi:cobalt/nickel ECF transporter CbiMNQO, S component CbiM [Campylobacter blaseri]|uniref:Cobalamin biosynthesis protein CbiM n=1 Tax=Campylobacter blaseri TaxID=2042961 RepID=A0A2P8R0V9_9BACT|nr:cobalt transporter CbiM [Campylobacter blaseri]PSM52119.1 cobalamin biosynthesis protein CbiM [Campylobacter blaseri]PSM53885.1 cobalamin biosynthesis protein CbiM [Campylobacter blaseri]QKF85319.1 cobalt/nickel ECF transporter CbiMNQO, S component CbiM [Campylobacter blaseri]